MCVIDFPLWPSATDENECSTYEGPQRSIMNKSTSGQIRSRLKSTSSAVPDSSITVRRPSTFLLLISLACSPCDELFAPSSPPSSALFTSYFTFFNLLSTLHFPGCDPRPSESVVQWLFRSRAIYFTLPHSHSCFGVIAALGSPGISRLSRRMTLMKHLWIDWLSYSNCLPYIKPISQNKNIIGILMKSILYHLCFVMP